VYTPDELGGEEPDGDVAPAGGEAAGVPAPADDALEPPRDRRAGREALIDVALECCYTAATVVALCRFFCDEGDLEALSAEQSAAMTGRLRAARGRAVTDGKLAAVAEKGLAMPDRARARQDIWLTRGTQV